MTITPALFFSVLGSLGVLILGLIVWTVILERRLRMLTRGQTGASLEDALKHDAQKIEELFHFRDEARATMSILDARVAQKLHGVKVLRFNPFQGTGQGGNQSFAAALLDEKGNGIVLSTLYTREKVGVYAKPIVNRTSEFELSHEEQEVLAPEAGN